MRLPRVPEKAVQAQVVQLLRQLGFRVWTLGTVRRAGDHPGTMQSPGLPDLLAFGRGHLLCVEVKARGGQLRPSQAAFRAECLAGPAVAHVVGGVDDVVTWLAGIGLFGRPVLPVTADVPEEGEAD